MLCLTTATCSWLENQLINSKYIRINMHTSVTIHYHDNEYPIKGEANTIAHAHRKIRKQMNAEVNLFEAAYINKLTFT